ncbi:MAG: nitrous oxide reductase accessory protein NosL [Nitrospirota bacterium]
MMMHLRRGMIAAVLAVALSSLEASAAPAPQFVPPAPRDKCPVCGMFAAKYPDWIAEVLFRDGSYAVFDGPKDLFMYLAGLKQYAPGKERKDIGAVLVNDYYAVRPISGFEAYYVVGSDVLGPMGRELIPFEREQDAREFMQDHHGGKILRFNDITSTVLKSLDQ